ncbi:MAG: cysteine--tRNA ligase, partial [Bifidobacterium castoris]|nr:cysteine--tRNA ligase [Bifidobacterium castoris]
MTEHSHEASNANTSGTFQDPQFTETLMAGDGGVANAAVDLRLYDTASHAISRFEPIRPGNVGIYVCGATVQSSPHIGHIRAGVAFDVIRRWFLKLGYRVTFIRNVTDIDDKILDSAAAPRQLWCAR